MLTFTNLCWLVFCSPRAGLRLRTVLCEDEGSLASLTNAWYCSPLFSANEGGVHGHRTVVLDFAFPCLLLRVHIFHEFIDYVFSSVKCSFMASCPFFLGLSLSD